MVLSPVRLIYVVELQLNSDLTVNVAEVVGSGLGFCSALKRETARKLPCLCTVEVSLVVKLCMIRTWSSPPEYYDFCLVRLPFFFFVAQPSFCFIQF